jgi:hypothetical protein
VRLNYRFAEGYKFSRSMLLNKQPLISSGPLTSQRYIARKVKKPIREQN